MKTRSTSAHAFLTLVTVGIIVIISGIAAALESHFELAMAYFVSGPLIVIGAHLLFPPEDDYVHPDHDDAMMYAMYGNICVVCDDEIRDREDAGDFQREARAAGRCDACHSEQFQYR